MNETLFTFPAESGSRTGGDKLFDLSGLAQPDGDASENPFAAMLAEDEATGQKEDANPSPALELMSGSSQAQQAETETENNTAHDKDAQQVKTPPSSHEDAEEMAESPDGCHQPSGRTKRTKGSRTHFCPASRFLLQRHSRAHRRSGADL